MGQNRKIGMIDGGIFLLFWSSVGMLSANYWHGALPVILFILIPVSAFIAWRGTKSVERIKAQKITNKTSAIEGGLYGLFITVLISFWSYSSQVYAAGSVFDGIPVSSLEFCKRIFVSYILIITAGTALGSIHGVLFYNFNKYLIKTVK